MRDQESANQHRTPEQWWRPDTKTWNFVTFGHDAATKYVNLYNLYYIATHTRTYAIKLTIFSCVNIIHFIMVCLHTWRWWWRRWSYIEGAREREREETLTEQQVMRENLNAVRKRHEKTQFRFLTTVQ